MRRLVTTIIMFAIALSVARCSGGEPNTMPDVVGKRLDIALSDVERAGFDDEVEVLGGGAFGVLDESNWTVCSQEPESGAEIAGVPRISVDRTCDTDDSMNPQATQKDEDTDEEQAATAPAKPKKKKRKPAAPVADTFVMPALVGMNLQEAQNALQDRGSFLLTQTRRDRPGPLPDARLQLEGVRAEPCSRSCHRPSDDRRARRGETVGILLTAFAE